MTHELHPNERIRNARQIASDFAKKLRQKNFGRSQAPTPEAALEMTIKAFENIKQMLDFDERKLYRPEKRS